jgi:S-DNA-T family DNA segregation ATPase FtsK/SpoIIIE
VTSDPDEPVRGEIEAGEVYETSFEVNLDPDEDRPDPARHKPVYVDATVVEHERRPIVPANLRTAAGIKATARRKTQALGYHAGYHASRSWLYAGLGLLFAPVGLGLVAWRLISWWWDLRSLTTEQEAVTSGDPLTFFKARREGNARRLFRGLILGACLLVLVAAGAALRTFTPAWVQAIVVLTAVPPLAHYGRLALRAKPIVSSAVVTPRFRKLNSDVVLRAYYAARLGNPDKPDQQIEFGSRMSRDAVNQGSEVSVDACRSARRSPTSVKAKAKSPPVSTWEQQVYLTRDKQVRAAPQAVRDRRRPAGDPGREDAAAGLQADRHLAAGAVRPRRTRPEGLVCSCCGSRSWSGRSRARARRSPPGSWPCSRRWTRT